VQMNAAASRLAPHHLYPVGAKNPFDTLIAVSNYLLSILTSNTYIRKLHLSHY